MTDHPLLFRAEMVRALLEGRKTQTRRSRWRLTENRDATGGGGPVSVLTAAQRIKVGDRVWVRETWCPHSIYEGIRPAHVPRSRVFYRADDRYSPSGSKWRSSLHMPRWASRLTLIVTGARIERLQDISEEDALAEGAARSLDADICGLGADDFTFRAGFRSLYERIRGKDAWAANPEVVVLTFTVHKANIDVGPC